MPRQRTREHGDGGFGRLEHAMRRMLARTMSLVHSDELRLVPLGGLGEIGMNCLALEQGEDILIVDCGVTFPSTDSGVDLFHPRFDWLLERRARVRGLVLTHGHEDHIGAVPYLLDALRVPIWGPRHALSLVRHRLEEHDGLADDCDFFEMRPRERFHVGSFSLEPLRVTHSITEATALAIDTQAGLVVHTGDFKLDERPTDGETTDLERLGELGDAGVRLLLSDSTNVDSPGTSTSEQVVGEALERTVAEASGRVVVGIFASNVQRLALIGAIARKTGRKLCLLGRSVLTHVRVATETGHLDWPSDLVVAPEQAAQLPRAQVLLIASGTQAEPLAALARLAQGAHPKLTLEPGDRVVFSSRIIPGNDRAVYELYAHFARRGIEVRSRVDDPGLHASGHAHREELRRMMELVRPRSFLPVHGTRHHLERHAKLARALGIDDHRDTANGDVVQLGRDRPLERVAHTPIGRVAIFDRTPLADEILRERTQLGRAGVVTVAVALDGAGRLVAGPELRSLGVLGKLEADVLERASRAVAARLERGDDDRDRGGLAESIRLTARRSIEADTGRRAIVSVSILRPR